jgi:hypothetical protein
MNGATLTHRETSTSEARSFGFHEQVTPIRTGENQGRRESDSLADGSKIGYPLQLVIAIVTVALTVYGAVWAANSRNEAANASMRMDIALIRQMQADQVKVDEYKSRLEEERAGAMTRAITELKARIEMTDLKVNNLRETVLTNQRR